MSTVANLEKNNEIQTFGDNPQLLLTIAIQNGANVEQLEKLLLLKERWDAAQAKKSFLAAISRFQSQTIGNHYTPPNARYNAQIRSIGRIFCLPCLFGCGECPKPCHARIFWQGVNRPHLGADFHK